MDSLPKLVLEAISVAWKKAREIAILQQKFFVDYYIESPPNHVGDPPLPVDALVHELLSRELKQRIPGLFAVIGEEAVQTLTLKPGDYVAVVDAIDGTKPFTHLACAWSIVVLLLQGKKGNAWEIPVVAMSNSTGLYDILVDGHRVFSGLIDDLDKDEIFADCAVRDTADPLSVAVVAAKGSDRLNRLIPLHNACDKDTLIFNVGGNPVIHGVIGGKLDAIVSFHEQTIWDAAYALIISGANGAVGDLKGKIYSRIELLKTFRNDSRKKRLVEPLVEPLVAGKDAETYQKVIVACKAIRRV